MSPARTTLLALLALALLLVASPAFSIGRTGDRLCPQDLKSPDAWPVAAPPDPRAELLIPVNVVRIYSDEHSAASIAPDRWISAQLLVANRLFRYSEEDMAGYGAGRAAPVIQFRLNKVYDVHEREVSETLGYPLDTECVFGAVPDGNGTYRVGTKDLRTLKVTDEVDNLTVFAVYAIKNPVDEVSEFGGESNVGFADRAPTGPRRVLTRVSDVRARLGVVTCRQEGAWMNNFAHEIGHFFGLPHAWERDWNARLGMNDLGNGPQGNVDGEPGFANVMDYENGDGVVQYFTLTQLDFMARFAREQASKWVRVDRSSGGAPPPPPPATAEVRIDRVWVSPPAPGGEVVVHAAVSATGHAGRPLNVVVWYYDASGQEINDLDGEYRTVGGQVSVGSEITPSTSPWTAADLALTLPTGQMHLPTGRHSALAVVGVFSGGVQVFTAAPIPFDYEVPGAPPTPAGGGEAAAWIQSATVDATAIHEGQPWVRIVANILAHNLRGSRITLQARFAFTDNTPLRDFDGSYATPDGFAFAENGVVVEYDQSQINGLEVWIPLAQLHLAEGAWDIVAALSVTSDERMLASGTTPAFRAGQGAPPVALAPAAEVHEVWFTYGDVIDSVVGMTVHSRITVQGLRGQAVQFVSWFWKGDATPLLDFDGNFRTADGQVSASVTLAPLYDVAIFTDCAIFIPYPQLHLAPGVHPLGVTLGVFSGGSQIGSKVEMTQFQLTQQ